MDLCVRERANLAITLAGKEDEVLAFAAFNDHPVVESVDPALWEQWLHSNYTFPLANVRLGNKTEMLLFEGLWEILSILF